MTAKHDRMIYRHMMIVFLVGTEANDDAVNHQAASLDRQNTPQWGGNAIRMRMMTPCLRQNLAGTVAVPLSTIIQSLFNREGTSTPWLQHAWYNHTRAQRRHILLSLPGAQQYCQKPLYSKAGLTGAFLGETQSSVSTSCHANASG